MLASVLLTAFLLPLLFSGQGSAAQITSRSLTLSTAVVSASSVTYTYGFTVATAGAIQGIQFQACTTALGSCTPPTTQNINLGSPSLGSGWVSSTAFTRDATGNANCTPANNVLCIKRTSATSETAVAKTLSESTQTNPGSTGSFFIRITTYSDSTWATPVDTGTVASSTTATITISAQIAEVLNFCIGSTTVNNDSTTPGADCSNISGTSINLGTLDANTVAITPVTGTGTGFGVNGVAMVRTNASNGTTVQYRALQQSGTNHLGTLRVTGATCTTPGNSFNDQCINAHGTTQGTFAAGTEDFGMTIAGVNCGSTTAYTCSYTTSGDNHLLPNAQYDGSGFTGGSSNTFGTGQGFAWDETGSFSTIATTTVATSTSAVDDEALILKFAATPNQVTPTGAYTAQTDFLIVSTY